jgi:hypothetical protein
MISWGTNPEATVPIDGTVPADAQPGPLGYMTLERGQRLAGTPIDAVFIGSCTNARLSDLRRAARLLEGRSMAEGVSAIVVPGSSQVKREAEAEGLDRIFTAAGSNGAKRLLNVLLRGRGELRSRLAGRFLHQSQFRRAAGPRHQDPHRQPGDRRRQRSGRRHRRPTGYAR